MMPETTGPAQLAEARQALAEAAADSRKPVAGFAASGPDVDIAALCQVIETNPPGMAANTCSAYRGALTKLRQWLSGRELNDETLAEYLTFLYVEGKSPAVASQVVSACTLSAQLSGQWRPSGPRTAEILAGYRRVARNRGTGRVTPLQWVQVDLCASMSADGTPKGLRDAALLVVMWDAMLEASQALALDIEDLEFFPDGTAALRMIGKAGALPERRRLQPQAVMRLNNWLYSFPQRRSGALFCRLDKSGRPHGRLTRQGIQLIVQNRAQAAGVPGRISSRSLRMGAARMVAQARQALTQSQMAHLPGQVLPQSSAANRPGLPGGTGAGDDSAIRQ